MHFRQSSGFTLIEISIVLVVIALIVGSVIGGQEMIAASKRNALIKDAETYKIAFELFTDRFKAYPGDFARATTYFTPPVGNGNGDGVVSWGNEGYYGFESMRQEGLINYQCTNFCQEDRDASPGENIPLSSYGAGVGITIGFSDLGGDVENAFMFGRGGVAMVAIGSFISPSDARNIDEKVDDGFPLRGVVRSTHNTGAAVQCQDGTNYTASNTVTCSMDFRLR